jgi:hypothetical protein
MKNKIYVCGNSLVPEDSSAIRILHDLGRLLPEIEFIPFDPTENFPEGDPVYFLDTVINAKDISVIEDISTLEDSPRNSVHDYDLGMQLKLLGKIGKLPKVIIFGVPGNAKTTDFLNDLVKIIRKTIPI